jgi:hypothetical protein
MSDLANPPQPRPTQAEADEFMADALGFGDDEGDAPEWVPAAAKIHIDFLGGTPQGRAWVDGTGAVEIVTLLPDYDPGSLVPGEGLVASPLLNYAGPLLAFALGSFTGRVQYFWPVEAAQTSIEAFFIRDASGSYALQLSLRFSVPDVRLQGYNEINLILPGAPLNVGDGAYNAVAFTITTGGRAEFAVNGSTVAAGTYDLDDRPTANPFDRARTAVGNLAIQRVTFYDPLPTTAGLSALSAIPSD